MRLPVLPTQFCLERRGQVPDSTKVYADIPKSPDLKVRVSADSFKDHSFISIREWYLPEDSPDLRPTKKGVTIPLTDSGPLMNLISALQDIYADNFE